MRRKFVFDVVAVANLVFSREFDAGHAAIACGQKSTHYTTLSTKTGKGPTYYGNEGAFT